MALEEYTHVCSLQFTTKDGETIELDFKTEKAAISICEYIKQNPPFNLESIAIVKNVYQVDHWENEGDDWDQTLDKLKNPQQ